MFCWNEHVPLKHPFPCIMDCIMFACITDLESILFSCALLCIVLLFPCIMDLETLCDLCIVLLFGLCRGQEGLCNECMSIILYK